MSRQSANEKLKNNSEGIIPDKNNSEINESYENSELLMNDNSEPDTDDIEYEDDFDEYYEIPDHNKPKKKKKKRKKLIRKLKISASLIMICIIFAVSIVLAVSLIYIGKEAMGIDKSSKTYILEIEEGSTTDDIANLLYEKNIIKIPELFKLFTRIQEEGGNFTAGEHQVSPNMDYTAMIKELTTPVADMREYTTVTFPEGITISDAADLLEESGICEAKSFIYFFNTGCDMSDYTFAQYLPSKSELQFYEKEGYLFPDTYDFYLDEDPEIVCQKIFTNFDNKFLPEYYTRMQELNMNINDVITLASMIQAEAGRIDDMKTISSVFHNRLNNPNNFPKLQSDPTKKYVEEIIKPNLKVANDNMELAYNTYESAGLPPGAICNPGTDAIEAALYPETTNYYYFYANIDTKITYFATTLEEHYANEEMVQQQYAEAED
jgi:UPF0755 protein